MSTPILTITGPTCSGKTTLLKALLASGRFIQLVGFTTRAPRDGEVDGVDYTFLSVDEAKQKIESDEVADSVFYNGNYYGVLLSEVEKAAATGKIPAVVLEPNGVSQFWERFGEDCVSVFLIGDPTTLTRRFLARFKDDKSADVGYYTQRLMNMYGELEQWTAPAKLRNYERVYQSCDEKTLPEILTDIHALFPTASKDN